MAHYIDGFVFPLAREHVETYQRIAQTVAGIWREHGASDYVEFIADDMNREGTGSFVDLVEATDSETVVFGWITYDSRESRDLVNQRVEADPRMVDLIAPLLDPSNPIFDSNRMAFAGFRPLVESPNKAT